MIETLGYMVEIATPTSQPIAYWILSSNVSKNSYLTLWFDFKLLLSINSEFPLIFTVETVCLCGCLLTYEGLTCPQICI